MNSGFAVLEGVAMRQAAKHNSQYNYILMYSSAATVVCPFVAALAVHDNSDGTSGKDIKKLLIKKTIHKCPKLSWMSKKCKHAFFVAYLQTIPFYTMQ